MRGSHGCRRGPGSYRIEVGSKAPKPPEPAMIGTGDRVTYGTAGVRGRLAVGLWAHPVAIDLDEDGKVDLIVGCPDRPYNGHVLLPQYRVE